MTEHPGALLLVAAGPGLGRAVARRFAGAGWSVGLLARTPERLARLAGEIQAAGAATVVTAAADVGESDALRAGLVDLVGRLGTPDVVVYNGSAYVEGSVLALTPEQLTLALAVGVTGALVTAQACVPAMRQRGSGTVILTGSVAADRASTSAAAVGVAKAGLRSLARSLHKEVAGDGVRVTTVTIDGVLAGPRALDLDAVAERYWRLHADPEPPPAELRHPAPAAGGAG